MYIKSFLLVLKSTLNEKYPNLKVDFYVSCRNWYGHMGLDQPLHSISYCEKFINDIESIWIARKHNNDSFVCLSWTDSFRKWKHDYLILKEKVWLVNCVFENLFVYYLRDSWAMREFHWKHIPLLQVMIYMQQSLRF